MSFLWSVDGSKESLEKVEKFEKSRKREVELSQSDEESEVNKTPKLEKKQGQKRPIERQDSDRSDQSEDLSKRSKISSNQRNEISSSLSSSLHKKRTANFDSDSDSESGKLAKPNKVAKSDLELTKNDNDVSEVDSSNSKLKFSADLSPKKILQSANLNSEESDSESEECEKVETKPKKNVILDAKALKEDQEKSEERGKKLLEAFDDE